MSFAYRPTDTDVTRATRRLATRRAAHARAALAGGEPPAEALHTARKDAKKLRALIKLVAPVCPAATAENRALRDAARGVSALRDRTSLVEAFDRIAPGSVAFAPVRAALAARAPDAAAHPAAEAARVAALDAAFEAVAHRSKRWKIKKKGFDALAPGLAAGYRRLGRAMHAARREGTAEAFHDWRKAAKVHWYHAGLLAAIDPPLMAPHVALAGDLAERLGDHHDLVVLSALLPALDVPDALRRDFAAHVAAERAALEARVFGAGARLCADRPKALLRRWRVWWDLGAE